MPHAHLIKMEESKKDETCNYCDSVIPAKTFHMVIADKIHFHIRCWELKRKKVRQQHGTY
jgi:hypothetical protein